MILIGEHGPPSDCRRCRHYFYRPRETFCHGCLALEYIGRRPPGEVVLPAGEDACQLFEPGPGQPS